MLCCYTCVCIHALVYMCVYVMDHTLYIPLTHTTLTFCTSPLFLSPLFYPLVFQAESSRAQLLGKVARAAAAAAAKYVGLTGQQKVLENHDASVCVWGGVLCIGVLCMCLYCGAMV